MNKEQIIEEWKKVGWNNLEDYKKDLPNIGKRMVDDTDPMRNLVDMLHPDKISAKEFWLASDIHFGTDAVANSNQYKDALSQDMANANNYKMFEQCGGKGMMDIAVNSIRQFNQNRPYNIIELACGYGAFREHYITNYSPEFNYLAFDIVPRFEEVIELDATPQGYIRDEHLDGLAATAGIALCFNAMQHMSKLQCVNYLKQVYNILADNGYFVLSYVQAIGDKSFHYGQLIDLFTVNEFRGLLIAAGFSIVAESYQYISGFDPCAFLCQKKVQMKTDTPYKIPKSKIEFVASTG